MTDEEGAASGSWASARRSIEAATGIDVAAKVIKFIEANAGPNKTGDRANG